MCKNPNCLGKLLGRLKFFVSKPALNIDGLSEATLEKFIELGWIKSFKDIFTLKDHFTEMVKLDGFGETSVKKILGAIEASKDVKLENFICALSIPNIGRSASKTISDAFNGDYQELIDAYFYWNFDWTTLDDFGQVMADSINKYLHDNLEEVNDLAAEMRFSKRESKVIAENPFGGKTLCVTGKLNHFTRDSINEKIAELGAKAAGSVSKNTDYLITNEQSGSSKYKKAVELNIPIITEQEFLNMIGE
jgi:DNA ligase (NAD+)